MTSKSANIKKIEYHYLYSPGLPGVDKKISGSVNSLRKIGHLTELKKWQGNFITKRLKMLAAIAKSNANILIIRHDCFLPFLYIPSYLFARALGKKIIIDIPTPLVTAISEFASAETNSFVRISKILLILLQHPICLFPANLILQYAPDKKGLTYFTNHKTKLIANGYDVSEVQITESVHATTSSDASINFLAIGTIADWHGYDRLLLGLHNHHQNKTSLEANITIDFIGDGPALLSLKALTEKLHLSDQVTFHGQLTGKNLTKYLISADLGIGTLGLHRKGLSIASPLKNREYCAYGLPFICSHKDIDFTDQEFALSIPPDDTPINIRSTLDALILLKQNGFDKKRIHAYGVNNIDFQAKWNNILTKLTPNK